MAKTTVITGSASGIGAAIRKRLEDEGDIRTAVHWLLAQPDFFINSVGDLDLLPAVLDAASDLSTAPADPVMAQFAKRAGLASIFGI